MLSGSGTVSDRDRKTIEEGCASGGVSGTAGASSSLEGGASASEAAGAGARRSTAADVDAARVRYLERKRRKISSSDKR
jgi:hypothetical protein